MTERPTPETDHVWQRHQGTTAEFFDAILIHARRLERQRDELLESLESFPGFTDDAEIGDPWSERARAAIASVKGGTP